MLSTSENLSVHEIDMEKGMDECSIAIDQFGEEHHWTKESAECLEQQSEKSVTMQKQINEISCNFSSSSRVAGVELPYQWVISTAAVRSLVILPEQE